jgi:hypothetical protein
MQAACASEGAGVVRCSDLFAAALSNFRRTSPLEWNALKLNGDVILCVQVHAVFLMLDSLRHNLDSLLQGRFQLPINPGRGYNSESRE